MSLTDPKNTIVVAQGASKTLALTVFDSTGNPVDLTGAVIYMTVRDSLEADFVRIRKTSTSPAEIQIPEPRNGSAKIFILPSDTETLDYGDYVYDIWVETGTGDRVPVVPVSIFRVERAVTRFV